MFSGPYVTLYKVPHCPGLPMGLDARLPLNKRPGYIPKGSKLKLHTAKNKLIKESFQNRKNVLFQTEVFFKRFLRFFKSLDDFGRRLQWYWNGFV